MRSALLASLLLMACTGEIIGDRQVIAVDPTSPTDPIRPTDPTTPTDPRLPPTSAFECTPGHEPSVTPLTRLSVLQYENSLRALFAPATGFDPLQAASAALVKLPVDEGQLAFSNQDLRFSEQHLTAWYETADSLAGAIVAAPGVLTAIAGACATQTTPTAACLNGFLDGFAKRAYRRPLTSEERTRYLALNDGTRDGKELFRSLVFSLLMAPQFLYHPEVNGTAANAAGTLLTLDAYELASRLSFHFWQAPPDDALLAAAADGSLLTDAGYRAQVARLVADARTRETMSRFYAEWFQLGRLTQFPTTPVFRAFAQGTTIGQPGADHLAAADAEIDALTTHFTWTTDGTLKDLLTTELSLTRSSHLAALYGVTPWDGTSPPPRMPPGQRSGLLTRMAMLTTGTHLTHPIHRGSFVRRRVLCDELPTPPNLPPDALIIPPPSAQQTTRQRFEDKVRNEPCASCHRMMNPIGYVLEQYDALGRHRTAETIFDQASGAVLSTLNVDTSTQPRVIHDDDATVSSPAQLSQLVADSGRVEACFARQYFRFTNRRTEVLADNCSLERLRVAVGGPGGSLKNALQDVALDPAFRTRKVE